MLDDLMRWLRDPANAKDYLRCMACSRLIADVEIGRRIKARLPACPCETNFKRAFTEPHHVAWWERKLILFRSILEYWRLKRAGSRTDQVQAGR